MGEFFQDDLRCLFSTNQVNHGGVQNAPAQVSLYKSKILAGDTEVVKLVNIGKSQPANTKVSRQLAGQRAMLTSLEVAGTVRNCLSIRAKSN